MAKIDSSGTKYYHQDHLSNRYVTDSSGNKVAEMGTFPYGESWYNASNDKLVFTSYERDSESGNDYAQARYNVSGLARFSSPDPIAGSTADPQSLNRYAYVRNMPVMLFDPSGMVTNCNTVENRDSNQPQDSKTGGPSASGDDNEGAEPDPQRPSAGCGYLGGGGGGILLVDGGFAGDDSGLGGVPGDGGGGGIIAWHGPGTEGQPGWVIGLAWGSDFGDPFGEGGAGGGTVGVGPIPVPGPTPPPGWAECMKALGENPNAKFSLALLRADNNWDAIQQAAAANGIDANILAAIGLRETGFQNIPERGFGRYERGMGVFQIDARYHADAIPIAYNIPAAADYAAAQISDTYYTYQQNGYSPTMSLGAAIRSYNASPGLTQAFANTGYEGYLDIHTRHGNYVSDVLAIAVNCFP